MALGHCQTELVNCGIVGQSDLVIATWTASNADLTKAAGFLRDGRIQTMRLMVDRSFEGRQPRYCETMRALFGDKAIRVWSSHAKFCIFSGGKFDVLYLTSVNLNANKRLENHTVVAAGEVPAQYLGMVNELFNLQVPGGAFGTGQKTARRDMETIYRARLAR